MDLFSASNALLDWLAPFAQTGLGDYAMFRLISGWISSRVDAFGLALMGRSMALVGSVGISCVIMWLLFQGYRILSGTRESMMGLVMQGVRIGLTFGVATTMAMHNIPLNSFLTKDLDKTVHYLVTGKEDESTANSIDKSLAVVQLAMTAIDGVQLLDQDPELLEEKRTAKTWATIGSTAPAVAAGCMLLLLHFAINLWIGLGPLFIFALAFPATRGMFMTWLKQGIGILFTLAVLSFVANLLLDMTVRLATFMWLSKLVNIPGVSPEGISSQAMQQGSIGMIMTVLIVSVPPMAAYYFQGQVGSVLATSAFARGGQVPAGSLPPSPPPAPVQPRDRTDMPAPPTNSHASRPMSDSQTTNSNEIKKKDTRE